MQHICSDLTHYLYVSTFKYMQQRFSLRVYLDTAYFVETENLLLKVL